MKNFVVHDQAGHIVRAGFCPNDSVALQTCGMGSLTVLVTAKHYPMLDNIKMVDGALWELVNDEWQVASSEPVPPDPAYPANDPPLG